MSENKATLSFMDTEFEYTGPQLRKLGDVLMGSNQVRPMDAQNFHDLFNPIMQVAAAVEAYKPPEPEPESILHPYPLYAIRSEATKNFFMVDGKYSRNVVIGEEVYETCPFVPDVQIDLKAVLFPVGPVLSINNCRLTGIITATDLGEQRWDVSNLPRAMFVKSPEHQQNGSMNLHFSQPGYPSVYGNLNRENLEFRAKGHVDGDAQVIGLEFAFDYLTSYDAEPAKRTFR